MKSKHFGASCPIEMSKLAEAERDWEELMRARNDATERMDCAELDLMSMYEEKIGMKDIFSKHGVPQPELFLALRPPWCDEQVKAAIRRGILSVGAVVVKPSHLTTGQAVFLVDKQLNGRPVLPVGPGRKVMEEAVGKRMPIQFSDMLEKLDQAMRQNAGAREVRPLRECPRGVLVEEMVEHEGEIRVLVLRGKVEVAATDKGVEVWRGSDGGWQFREEGVEGLEKRWSEVESWWRECIFHGSYTCFHLDAYNSTEVPKKTF